MKSKINNQKIIKIFFFILSILILFIFKTNVFSANWYIDNNAKGNNNGNSWENAWIGLRHVDWTSINPGDIIYISGGIKYKTYTDSMSIDTSGSAGNPITITVGANSPYPEGHSGKVVIDLNYSEVQNSGFRIINQSYINISGKINNSTDCNIKTTRSRYNGVHIEGTSNNFNISYLEISNNGTDFGFGIYMILNQDNNLGEIHHCIIYNNRTDAIRALDYPQFTATTFGSLKIHHNNIYDFHGDAVKIYLGEVDFYNNIIHDRGTYLTDHPDGIQADDSYLRIYNNVFYNFIRTDKDPNLNSYIRYGDFNGKAVKNTFIYNNLFAETRKDRSESVFRCIEMPFSNTTEISDIYFLNNTIIGIPLFGVYVGFGSDVGTSIVSNVYVENNIFLDASYQDSPLSFDNGDGSIIYGSHGSSADVTIDYNTVYSSSGYTYINYNGSVRSYSETKTIIDIQNNDTISDPELDDNYCLSESSPSRNVGIDWSSIFTTDLANENRNSWSHGALEATSYIIYNDNFPTINDADIIQKHNIGCNCTSSANASAIHDDQVTNLSGILNNMIHILIFILLVYTHKIYRRIRR